MAVLELCKANHLIVAQEVAMGEITISRGLNFLEENAPVVEGEVVL